MSQGASGIIPTVTLLVSTAGRLALGRGNPCPTPQRRRLHLAVTLRARGDASGAERLDPREIACRGWPGP